MRTLANAIEGAARGLSAFWIAGYIFGTNPYNWQAAVAVFVIIALASLPKIIADHQEGIA